MSGSHDVKALKAGWVLPIEGEPRANALVLIENGHILKVVADEKEQNSDAIGAIPLHDYGQAIIVPGLINLHSHLDYSHLSAFQTNSPLLPWTRSLMKAVSSWTNETWLSSALLGASQAAAYGTTFLVDSSYAGASACAIAQAGLKGLVGMELFGVDENKADADFTGWHCKLESVLSHSPVKNAVARGLLRLTVAPHSPYTVCPALWLKAKTWASENKSLVLSHIAESQHEYQWFVEGDELMDEHLQFAFAKFRQKPPLPSSIFAWKQLGLSPIEHLARHKLLDSQLLAAHSVKVKQSDLTQLASHDVAVAHCPRSNARLRNGYALFEQMRGLGIRTGLGTDSLASCHNLNLLAEARFAIELARVINPESQFGARDAIASITIDAARCLNLDDQIGSIVSGKKADLAIFTIPDRDCENFGAPPVDPYELLVHGHCRLSELFVNGEIIYRRSASTVDTVQANSKISSPALSNGVPLN